MPTPETPLAERLEHVRENVLAFDSLMGFWLAIGGNDFMSYEAARTYHQNREAPVKYLVRIVRVFPQVSLVWLSSGEGSPVRPKSALMQNALDFMVRGDEHLRTALALFGAAESLGHGDHHASSKARGASIPAGQQIGRLKLLLEKGAEDA